MALFRNFGVNHAKVELFLVVTLESRPPGITRKILTPPKISASAGKGTGKRTVVPHPVLALTMP
jgi:hypothetical protein